METRIPMNLQLFAEPAGGSGGEGGGGTPAQQPAQTSQQAASPAIDYAKIQQMLDGTLAAKEDTALKAYFRQQGLSQEDVEQAIVAFKQQKAAQQPDVGAIQQQLTQAQAIAQKAMVDSAATMTAVSLGIDAKTIPYVLKMADLSQVTGQDGKINEETLKTALNKVLEDIPALKPQVSGTTGFIQVGAASGGQTQQTVDTELDRIFGVKKK
nr:MAG TPA: Major head protein [Caudoviricetes sp.]